MLGRCEGLDEFGLREGLEGLDRHDADLEALRTQVGEQRAHVVGDRAEADHDVVGVRAVVRHDRRVRAAGECGVLVHRLADESWHRVREVRAVVNGARLEVGLVLDGSGDAGVVQVDEGGNELAGALLPCVDPLAAPLSLQVLGQPREGRPDEGALVVGLDRVGVAVKVAAQGGELLLGEVVRVPGQVFAELEDAALGSEEHVLSDGGGLDPARGIAQVLLQHGGLGKQGLAHDVAGREAVHRVGDGDEGKRRCAVGDRGKVGGLLGVGAEEDRVSGGQ